MVAGLHGEVVLFDKVEVVLVAVDLLGESAFGVGAHHYYIY